MGHFRTAIELDPGMELSKGNLGLTYYQQSNFREAMKDDSALETELLRMADEDSSDATMLSLHKVQGRMAQCYKKLRDRESAFRYYQEAFSHDAACNECAIELVLCYCSKGMYREVMGLFEGSVGEVTVPHIRPSRLTIFLRDLFLRSDARRALWKAALATRKLEFVAETYRNAAQDARRQLNPVDAVTLELAVAQYYVYLNEPKRAVRIWRKILDTYGTAKEDSLMSDIKDMVSVSLAEYLLLQAMKAREGSPQATRHILRLEDLAKKKSRSGNVMSTFVRANFPAVLLGLCYRLNGRNNDANDCFRPKISDTVQILSDDDPDNDLEGYGELCDTLMAAGDDKNVLALVYALGNYTSDKPAEEGNEEEKEEEDIQEKKEEEEEKFGCYCDGPCFRSFHNYDNMYTCSKFTRFFPN